MCIKNRRFGKLFVLNRMYGDNWACICECGSACMVRTHLLVRGLQTDCGCVFRPVTDGHVGRNQYEYEGRRYTDKEIEDTFGINATTFTWRIRNGWSITRAIETPARRQRSTLS